LSPHSCAEQKAKDDSDPNPKPDFHLLYRDIVGSLGYLVAMTRPDFTWSYSELSTYVQFHGIAHMEVAEHVLQYLRDIWNESIEAKLLVHVYH